MDLRQIVFQDYRNPLFISLSALTSALAVRPDATVLPLIATLSVLLVYAPFLFRTDSTRMRNVILTWVALLVGSQVSRIHASLDALSTPGSSILLLFASSGVLSALTLSTVYVSTRNLFSASSFRSTLFPALWTTTWCTVSHLNPIGHLATWSAVDTEDPYKWLISIVGPSGKDWIIAAWAVVFSQAMGHWYMGTTEDILGTSQKQVRQNSTRSLAFFLVLLSIPSFFLSPLPLPMSYSTVDISTPISVACALPSYTRYKNHVLTLSDFITESKTIQNRADIILWPEGAVSFRSEEERDQAFDDVRANITGAYVGVSFEETVRDPADSTGQRSISRTGLAIVSHHSSKPHLVYYKRNLVPVAESYRLRNSLLPPSLFELPIARPNKWISKEEWGGTNRLIPITASICLDFAQASPFAELESRPGLILAPARTWDRTIGYAMWLQAKQRAEEQNAAVLWCDGGEGGVSGLAGGGFSDVAQVGPGSFVRTIGINYPFDERRTVYARFGDFVLVFAWLPIFFLQFGRIGPLLVAGNRGPLALFQGTVRYIQRRRRGGATDPPEVNPHPTGNLVDL